MTNHLIYWPSKAQQAIVKLYWCYRRNGSTPARAWEAAMLSVAIGMTLD